MTEKKYPRHILAMLDYDGFYTQWVSRLGFYRNYEDAYEATEVFFEGYFGRRRYGSFQSFKNQMSKNANKSR